MTEPTYTDRTLTPHEVKESTLSEDGTYHSILTDDDGGFGTTPEIGALLPVGKSFSLETQGFTQITGFVIDGEFVGRKSDQDLADEHAKFVADLDAKRAADLEANREAWQAREDALPEWLRIRLATFHERGGENFRRDGWGYELAIAELAALMDGHTLEEINDEAMEDVNTYAHEQGVSGNQWGFAISLTRQHKSEPERSFASTPGGLTPLTGDPFYEGKNR